MYSANLTNKAIQMLKIKIATHNVFNTKRVFYATVLQKEHVELSPSELWMNRHKWTTFCYIIYFFRIYIK